MDRFTEPTRAARLFRVMVVVASAVLGISAYLPWCRINGFTYSFFTVDSWKALPITELVIAGTAVVASVVRLRQIKRIALIAGFCGLAVNLGGSVVAARLADVHNSDTYFRLWAVITIRPELGGWLALSASVFLIVGASARWSVRATRIVVPDGLEETPHFEGGVRRGVHVPFEPSPAEVDPPTRRPGLPHLDDVLASPKPPAR